MKVAENGNMLNQLFGNFMAKQGSDSIKSASVLFKENTANTGKCVGLI